MSKAEIEFASENAEKLDDLISRSALLKDIDESVVFSVREGVPSAEIRGANKITARIKAAPAVDAVEVVRCRDCVHYQFGFCMKSILYSKDPNGFCESGERRDDE